MRLRIVGLVVFIVLLAILVKVLYIQLWRYDFLSEQAHESWNRQLPQSSERGLILDCNQEYLIYIAIDAPQGPSQFGGTIAAPIVGELFEAIAEDSKRIHIKERTWDEIPELKVPNLVGLSKDEIQEQLHEFKLIWHGDSQKILDQLPAPDELAKPPYLIHLYTD